MSAFYQKHIERLKTSNNLQPYEIRTLKAIDWIQKHPKIESEINQFVEKQGSVGCTAKQLCAHIFKKFGCCETTSEMYPILECMYDKVPIGKKGIRKMYGHPMLYNWGIAKESVCLD